MLHVPCTPIPVPHELVWLKSPGSVPEMLMFEIESGAVPGFVSVIVLAALVVPVSCAENERLVGENFATGKTIGSSYTVPPPEAPPAAVVPYMLPAASRTNPATGNSPSGDAPKLYSIVS